MPTLSPSDTFHDRGHPLAFTVGDFWRWAASDLTGNLLRGLVAEYLVARAVGATSEARVEWDATDLVTARGTRVEVKCSGYVQSWPQAAPSRPSFDVAPKRSWNAATGASAQVPGRPAALYVFALHHHKDKTSADSRDVSQWSFFVVPTHVLDAAHPSARRVSLKAVVQMAGLPVGYSGLAARVAEAERQLLPRA